MSKPIVFVSSTYVDLKHVREHVAEFISMHGYLPRLFEKGGIGFDYQKPIDESCYEAVAECDMFVLVIGGRYGAPSSGEAANKIGKYNSITRKEYLEARKHNIPIYIFVDKEVLAEYRTYTKNRRNKSIQYAFVDNPQIFEVIDDIFGQNLNNYVHSFSCMQDITDVLRDQWAALVKSHIRSRQREIKRNTVKINSLKLFYFRRIRGLSQNNLARLVGIDRRRISTMENLRRSRGRTFEGYHLGYFPETEYSTVARLEKALDCPSKLTAGAYDDFHSMYVEYYTSNHGTTVKAQRSRHPLLGFETKIVVFDFDGTMTVPFDGLTTWEQIWQRLGYSINECAAFHSAFQKKEITHQEWCEITRKKFSEKEFSRELLSEIASETNLIPGFNEVVDALHSKGKKLFILSGSIRELIIEVLGGKEKDKFEEIKANEMRFSPDGTLKEIIGTKYDFWGKADFLKRIVEENRCSPMDVLYVGNAANDRWASNSGARTLCVNPTSTDPDNPKTWTHSIKRMEDMREILPFVT